MLKSEVQHQFWVTKKAVQRKFGSKEDEYIVSSDAGLDSKIALFKSISDTCAQLNKVIDQYQERLCILSQEECTFGRFLKEIGKRSKTTGTSITNSGKAIYYCGQQRMSIRLPLIRLQHEVDVFRCRAIEDTLTTVRCMEKERTEYRAALCWMKSLSIQLDPDNNKGLDKFRRAQFHVRSAKESFDKLSMDCIQKIDLLSAARCNMFSHCLVAYMSALLQFSKKSASTFKTVSSSLTLHPRYDFCILKDLSQNSTQPIIGNITVQVQDIDQSLFFSEAFHDKENVSTEVNYENPVNDILIELSQAIKEIDITTANLDNDLSSLWTGNSVIDKYFTDKADLEPKEFLIETNKKSQCKNYDFKHNPSSKSNEKTPIKNWFDLFADLDPLENFQSFDMELNGKSDSQQT